MANNRKNKTQKSFQLNLQDEMHKKANDFINIAPRFLGSLCAIALTELMQTYHLENASAEDIKNFTIFYKFYKAQMEKEASLAMANIGHYMANPVYPTTPLPMMPNPVIQENVPIETQPEIKEENDWQNNEESLVSKEDKEAMKAIMSNAWLSS